MPYFDRFDICAAYALLEHDYNIGGILRERPSCNRRNKGRGESVGYQLSRIGYNRDLIPDITSLGGSENAWEIYNAFETRHGLNLNISDARRFQE